MTAAYEIVVAGRLGPAVRDMVCELSNMSADEQVETTIVVHTGDAGIDDRLLEILNRIADVEMVRELAP